jgi:hypothetical protein
VTFRASSVTNVPGTSVVVRVSVSGFNQIGTAQGTLVWDPSVVRFSRVEEFGLAGLGVGNFGTNRIGEGKLSFSWDDPNAVGVTAADGTVMFAVRLDIVGAPGSDSPVTFSDSIAACEATVNLQAITFQPVAGHVKVLGVSPVPNGLQLAAPAFGAGAFGVAVPTESGKNYILEYTDTLSAPKWKALPAVPGNGAVQTLHDPSPAATQRFYRLRIE